jgi:hypothetical protein
MMTRPAYGFLENLNKSANQRSKTFLYDPGLGKKGKEIHRPALGLKILWKSIGSRLFCFFVTSIQKQLFPIVAKSQQAFLPLQI